MSGYCTYYGSRPGPILKGLYKGSSDPGASACTFKLHLYTRAAHPCSTSSSSWFTSNFIFSFGVPHVMGQSHGQIASNLSDGFFYPMLGSILN